MMRRYFKYIILIALLSPSIVFADQSARPKDVNLSNFQFGPFNRWSFSHLREVLPTVNIERSVEQTLKHYIPEVKSIVGRDDEEAAGQGYEPYIPKDKEPDWKKFVR